MSKARVEVVERQIREAILGLKPLLSSHAGNVVDFMSFDVKSGVVILRLEGGCPDCDMPTSALMKGIEAHLMLRVPEIRSVRMNGSGTEGGSL
jgi:Fe-S cluster biogenesis protein NfuA